MTTADSRHDSTGSPGTLPSSKPVGSLNVRTLVIRSLGFHRRLHLATALAVAIATAVIIGALVVGDSVRDSLRRLTVERLGRIDHILLARGDARADLARQLQTALARSGEVIPAWILPRVTVSALRADGTGGPRSSGVLLVASGQEFWSCDVTAIRPAQFPSGRKVVVNRRLADELGLSIADRIAVRLPERSAAPAETPFGRRDANVRSLVNLEVVDIVPNRGLGRFALYPSQEETRLLWMDPNLLQQEMSRPDLVNALLVAGTAGDRTTTPSAAELASKLKPKLTDFGISVHKVQATYRPESSGEDGTPVDSRRDRVAWQYWNITSDQLLLSDVQCDAIQSALQAISTKRLSEKRVVAGLPTEPHRTTEGLLSDSRISSKNARGAVPAQQVLTYLANSITRVPPEQGGRAIPYSMVSALDGEASLGPWPMDDGHAVLADDEIALNTWAAAALHAQRGDLIELKFFVPETAAGESKEKAVRLRVGRVIPIERPITPYQRDRKAVFDTPPTRANDPDLTPTVRGVTDRESIEQWDPPFSFDAQRIQRADDAYWAYFRTTPKAFVSLATGIRIWGSRFGRATSFRVPAEAGIERPELQEAITRELQKRQGSLGFVFLPVKEDGLRAAEGTTPFAYLFLGFSLFLVASALLLVGLIVGLGLETRWREMGLLLAVGWTAAKVRQVYRTEAFAVAVAGAVLGVLPGMAYAAVMAYGLRTWWVSATVAPVVHLSLNPATLAIGWLSALLVCLLVVGLRCRRLASSSPLPLLAGSAPSPVRTRDGLGRGRRSLPAAALLLVAALVLLRFGLRWSGESQAGAFFGAGAILLIAGLLFCHDRLCAAARSAGRATLTFPWQLSWRSSTRHVQRSLVIIALVASAVFLLTAISAFRLAPTAAGTGGFQWVGQTDVPLFEDFQDPRRMDDLDPPIRPNRDGPAAEPAPRPTIVSLLVRSGDDASCRNLFQTAAPRLIGISPEASEQLHGRFRFAASRQDHPWSALFDPSHDGSIPVILDQNTARYGLKLYGGIGEEFHLNYADQPIAFRVVGLLSNSILQGSLLISAPSMHRQFPEVTGYRQFLIDTGDAPPAESSGFAMALEQRFDDQGMDVRSADVVLRELLAIQNTYLSTFQSLGMLGLLLGTAGLAVVEVRNILARRKELALMAALGFRAERIRRLVAREHFGLLVLGMAVGLTAALITVVPALWVRKDHPSWSDMLGALACIGLVGWLGSRAASWIVRPSMLLRALRNE